MDSGSYQRISEQLNGSFLFKVCFRNYFLMRNGLPIHRFERGIIKKLHPVKDAVIMATDYEIRTVL